MDNTSKNEKNFERLDLSVNDEKKQWSKKLIITTILLGLIFFVSPIASFGLITSTLSFLIMLSWLIICIVLRKKYKVWPLIIVDIITLIFIALILYSHVIMYSIEKVR